VLRRLTTVYFTQNLDEHARVSLRRIVYASAGRATATVEGSSEEISGVLRLLTQTQIR
jgi:hypothetical protein